MKKLILASMIAGLSANAMALESQVNMQDTIEVATECRLTQVGNEDSNYFGEVLTLDLDTNVVAGRATLSFGNPQSTGDDNHVLNDIQLIGRDGSPIATNTNIAHAGGEYTFNFASDTPRDKAGTYGASVTVTATCL